MFLLAYLIKQSLGESQHNKARHPRWVECNVPPFAVVHIFGHRGLQVNYNVFYLLSLCTRKQRDLSRILSAVPPLPVLRFTLWYPTYIRKQLWEKKKKKKTENPTWYRHLLVDTQYWTIGKTSSLFSIIK